MVEATDAARTFEALAHAARLEVLRLLVPAGPRGMAAGEIGPKLMLAAAVPHALFGLFLWGLCRLAFGRG